MKSSLYSENMIEFFNAVSGDYFSLEEISQKIRENIILLKDDLFIGRLDMDMDIPISSENEFETQFIHTIYMSENECGEEPYVVGFQTGEAGHVKFIFYPEKDHIWSENESSCIFTLAKLMYMLCGRTRLLGLIRQVSMTDQMTGLWNVHGFKTKGKEICEKYDLSDYNFFYINIKSFKYLNQKYTTRIADDLLILFSKKIEEFFKEDEIVARIGGDSFIAIVRKERSEELSEFLSSVTVEISLGGKKETVEMSARAGIYAMRASDSLSEGMNAASTALVTSKTTSSGDFVHYEEKMLEKELHERKILAIFPGALRNREFLVYYQPKVSLETRKLCGSEALVRWKRDDRIVPPMEFIPILEKEGIICLLDFYVFEQVCKDIRRWCDEGIVPVKVSVNFSKMHLYNDNFSEEILDMIKRYDIDCRYLELELTETASYDDYEVLTRFVTNMRNSGIEISIDDFGTGYSSLNLLKDLNVDVVKLDKTFVNDIEQKRKTDKIVVKNIVNMVNELDMKMIAEGVETGGQAEFLKSVNCSMAQGYLFDRPLPCEEYEQRLRGNRVYNIM